MTSREEKIAKFDPVKYSLCEWLSQCLFLPFSLFLLDIDMERVADETDVLIVGGGPAGLTTAIKLKQLAAETGADLRVTLVEKASEMGNLQTIIIGVKPFFIKGSHIHDIFIYTPLSP